MILKFHLLAFVALILTSCISDVSDTTIAPTSMQPSDSNFVETSTIKIDTFSVFPPEIDGAACYFSNNEKEFENGIYIYVDNYGDSAFIHINGKLEKFKSVKSDSTLNNDSADYFRNEKYSISIETKKVGTIDYTTQLKGVIIIKSNDGAEVKMEVFGECGC